MPRPFHAALLVLATIALAACGESLAWIEEDGYTLPERDRSLNPAKLAIGGYLATPCGTDQDLRSRSERALVDIFFGRKTNNDAADGPQDPHIRAVTSRGGAVLHRFNVPAVRARINLNQIPDLVAAEHWVTVREVPNPARYDLQVNVGYARPIRESDLRGFRELGGRITYRFDFINGISGEIPDHSIPELRKPADVLYVEADGIACLAG